MCVNNGRFERRGCMRASLCRTLRANEDAKREGSEGSCMLKLRSRVVPFTRVVSCRVGWVGVASLESM